MKKIAISLFSLFLFFPFYSNAACLATGVTVVYVNGILTTNDQAIADAASLRAAYRAKTQDFNTAFINGYNPSHLAGAGDLLETLVQGFGTSITDFDRDTILLQIYPEVTTRRLLLVGHSQGNFYTNGMYDYLLSHGEPKESVGVYSVATPASYVAGGGSYLTSSFDVIIGAYRDWAKKVGALAPLAPDIELPLTADSNGHGFSSVYLAQAGERVVSDIQNNILKLKASMASDTGDCFTPPAQGIGYKTQQAVFAVADPIVTGTTRGVALAYQGTVAATNATVAAIGSISSSVAAFFGSGSQPQTADNASSTLSGSDKAGFTLLKAIAGSSLNLQDLEELNSTQGGAVVQAANQPVPKSTGQVKGVETQKPPQPLIPFPSAPEISSPGYGGGGGVAQSNNAEVLADATSSPVDEASSTPLFDASTVPPALSITECGDLILAVCSVDTASITLEWSAVVHAIGYGVEADGVLVSATTTDLTTTFALTPGATSTLAVRAYDASGASLISNSIEVATATPVVVAPPPEVTIAAGLVASVLGGSADTHPPYIHPEQRLGHDLSGTLRSVAYKVHGSDIAAGITDGYGWADLFDCYSSGSYTPFINCALVSTSTGAQIVSQSGDDATILTTMSPYVFYPTKYYVLVWKTSGDLALYGSAENSFGSPLEQGVWGTGYNAITGSIDGTVIDWGFRLCESDTCSF